MARRPRWDALATPVSLLYTYHPRAFQSETALAPDRSARLDRMAQYVADLPPWTARSTLASTFPIPLEAGTAAGAVAMTNPVVRASASSATTALLDRAARRSCILVPPLSCLFCRRVWST